MSAAIVNGIIVSFDSSTYLALVMLRGSLAEVEMPVGEWVPPGLLAADDEVAVLLFDASDTQDGVILGPFGAAPASYFEQAEIAAPATPASGYLRWFADSGQSWGYFINDAGATVPAGVATVSLPLGAAQGVTATAVAVQTHHQALSFADGSTQLAYWSFKLPRGWAGRSLVVRIVWAPSTTNGGDVLWGIEHYQQKAGTTLSSSSTDAKTQSPTANGTADRPQVTTFVASPLSAYAEGEALSLRLFRAGANGLDTFTGAARLLAIELSVVG